MFRQGQLAVQRLAILLGRNEAGISNRGKLFLHHAVGNLSDPRIRQMKKSPEEIIRKTPSFIVQV